MKHLTAGEENLWFNNGKGGDKYIKWPYIGKLFRVLFNLSYNDFFTITQKVVKYKNLDFFFIF